MEDRRERERERIISFLNFILLASEERKYVLLMVNHKGCVGIIDAVR